MAGTFTPTQSYSNLSILELEQLRRADFYAGGKALTIGDAALSPYNFVGKGDVNAERFYTGPSVVLGGVYALTPPGNPGPGLLTTTTTADLTSETVRWYGPTRITHGTAGEATGAADFTDTTANFVTAGVQPGDILLIKPNGSGSDNENTVAVVDVVATTTLTVAAVKRPDGGTMLAPDAEVFRYVVIRKNAVQLFAVPGSGPTGREQTFLTVAPGSFIHNQLGPTLDAINNERVRDLVPAHFGADSTVDRSDAIFPSPAPFQPLDKLGYRVILYPDIGDGSGPDLTKPIATLNPIIDPSTSIPAGEQRFTIDYKAGIIRFSTAPATGGDIKPSGATDGTNPTTGRLNLYATFFAVDLTETEGASRAVFRQRSTESAPRAPGRIRWDGTLDAWHIGQSADTNDFFVQAFGAAEEPGDDFRNRGATFFGTYEDPSSSIEGRRYFVYRQGSNTWRMFQSESGIKSVNHSRFGEVEIGQRLAIGVGDISYPPLSYADKNPPGFITTSATFGRRSLDDTLADALKEALYSGYSNVRLRKGEYWTSRTLHIPPGVTLEGEGASTIIRATKTDGSDTMPALVKLGPNTPTGVYDPSYDPATGFAPTTVDFPASSRIEGVDVCWNPVRRVWAVVTADIATNGIYFNEIRPDGTKVFVDPGLDVKDSADLLFTTGSGGSEHHTPGHYPRIDYSPNSDQYVIAWVCENTAGIGAGPEVQFNVFMIQPHPETGEALKTSRFPWNQKITGLGFSDHPSVAFDKCNNDSLMNQRAVVSCWTFDTLPEPSSSAHLRTYVTSVVSTQQTIFSEGSSIVSSTDVCDDGQGGFMFVWSRRLHRMYAGTAGSFDATPSRAAPSHASLAFTDASITISSTATAAGSRLCVLGDTYEPGWTVTSWDANGAPGAFHWGSDYTFVSVGSPSVVKMERPWDAVREPFTPFNITSGTGSGAGTTTLTDGSKNFTALGVKVGDFVFESGGYVRITAVGTTTLTVDANLSGPDPFNYSIYVGRPFAWRIVPPSVIEGKKFSGTAEAELGGASVKAIVGQFGSTAAYYPDMREPDYVRIASGGDKFLVVFQSFNTTAYLSSWKVRNSNDGRTAALLDKELALQDNEVWREHVATCYAMLGNDGTPIGPFDPADAYDTSNPNFLVKAERDFEWSNASLGARPFIGFRPNKHAIRNAVVAAGESYRSRRNVHNTSFDREVSFLNFAHRWPPDRVPGLLPDVTWSGSDWTIVSPSKQHIHSYTGVYHTDGGGDVYLSDGSFYFGGGGASMAEGLVLPRTVAVGTDEVYFPSVGLSATIVEVYSDHTVRLSADVLGLGVGAVQTKTEWYLIKKAGAIPTGGEVKNPGFRVSADGEIVVSTAYTTFADEDPESNRMQSQTSLMRRGAPDYTFSYLGETDQVGYNLPGDFYEERLEAGSRLQANIRFQGVAVGVPRGTTYELELESPSVAIAWGDNLFGFVERDLGTNGSSALVNRLAFSRQSFGPYGAGLRNVKLVGAENASNSDREIRLLSQAHVLTRHWLPVTSTVGFATDGYRNVFAYPSIVGNNAPDTLGGVIGTMRYALYARYTDVIGDHGIDIEGPAPRRQTLGGTGFRLYPSDLYVANAAKSHTKVGPKTIWDGRRFVVVWVEQEPSFPTTENVTVLCMTTFPGDEDGKLQASEIGCDQPIIRRRISTVIDTRFSEGEPQITAFDVAYSGSTYAILFCQGIDDDSVSATEAASMVGVALVQDTALGGGFEGMDTATWPVSSGIASTAGGLNAAVLGGGAPHSGSTPAPQAGDTLVISYPLENAGVFRVVDVSGTGVTLDRPVSDTPVLTLRWALYKQEPLPGTQVHALTVDTGKVDRKVFTSPKIVWDGHQFLGVWCATRANHRQVQYAFITEGGLSVPPVVRRIAGPDATVAGVLDLALGTVTASGEIAISFQVGGMTPDQYFPPIKIGDILVIENVYDSGSGSYTAEVNGSYAITGINFTDRTVALNGPALSTLTGATVYGTIITTGVGDTRNYPSTTSFGVPTGLATNPKFLKPFSTMASATSNIGAHLVQRVDALVYNPQADEYAILFRWTTDPTLAANKGYDRLSIATFKRDTMTLNEKLVESNPLGLSEDSIIDATLVWNGEHYAACWISPVRVRYRLFTSNLTPIGVRRTILSDTDVIGTSAGKIPGPLYGSSVPTINGVFNGISARWNDRLGRFVMALSIISTEAAAQSGTLQRVTETQVGPLVEVGSYGPNGTITFTGGTPTEWNKLAPGNKLILVGTSGEIAAFDILSTDVGTATVTVDHNMDYTWNLTDTDTGKVYVLPREDVLCLTLGYGSPAVKIEDADDVWLDNVQIGGAPLDIEEAYPRMGRPIWQAAGPPYGRPTLTAQALTAHDARVVTGAFPRLGNRNHRFLKPEGKVPLAQFTNVRSATPVKRERKG